MKLQTYQERKQKIDEALKSKTITQEQATTLRTRLDENFQATQIKSDTPKNPRKNKELEVFEMAEVLIASGKFKRAAICNALNLRDSSKLDKQINKIKQQQKAANFMKLVEGHEEEALALLQRSFQKK